MTGQFTMNAYAEKEDLYKAKAEYYEKALMQIRDKFEDKHELHKDDIFCYNIAKEVLIRGGSKYGS